MSRARPWNYLVAPAVLTVATALLAAPVPGEGAVDAQARLRGRVEALTAPAFAGRAAGSPGAASAADTLAAWFAAAGLEPAFAGAWRQEFPLTGQGWTGDSLVGRNGANVGARLAGAGTLAGRWLVVGAHLDHLGEVAPGAALPAAGNFYPGANDNASGIAIVHELAARLASAPAAGDRRSVLFLNLDAEEVGLQGAAWFVNHAPVVLDSVDAMVNLDTVGRLSDGRLIVSGIGTAEPLAAAVEHAASATSVTVNASRGGWSGSDHMVFNTREVPVLFLFGGPYPEYNRPTDDAAALDYRAMARVADFATALVAGLRAVPGRFTWQMVAGGGLRDEADAPRERARETGRPGWVRCPTSRKGRRATAWRESSTAARPRRPGWRRATCWCVSATTRSPTSARSRPRCARTRRATWSKSASSATVATSTSRWRSATARKDAEVALSRCRGVPRQGTSRR
jgi:hypothetical protein